MIGTEALSDRTVDGEHASLEACWVLEEVRLVGNWMEWNNLLLCGEV